MTRDEVLKAAMHAVTGQREQDYGRPEDNFYRIARLWNVYLELPTDKHLDDLDVANMMILFKMARIMSGRHHEDNFVDIAGYAALAGELSSSYSDVSDSPSGAEQCRVSRSMATDFDREMDVLNKMRDENSLDDPGLGMEDAPWYA